MLLKKTGTYIIFFLGELILYLLKLLLSLKKINMFVEFVII